ncbi:hypothetical protein AAF712_015251 [Marasmius tenuissimus]|uniref:Uncharacterized protein n=1 Tax=Marasmius tenuissimus TaxID=585030 RepID=A0ABR2Z913_9AGAR
MNPSSFAKNLLECAPAPPEITARSLSLKILLNDEGDNFLSLLTPVDRYHLSKCCIQFFRDIFDYNLRLCGIDRYLSSRINEDQLDQFRAIQSATGAVIGGTSAMHFFEGARSLESDSLNIYVDHASWKQFLPFLLNVGYEYSAEHPQPTTLSALFNWTSSLNIRNAFAIDYEVRTNCNWRTGYPVADPCRGLASHLNPSATACGRCDPNPCDESSAAEAVLNIIERRILSNDGVDNDLRTFIATAFRKIPEVGGKQRDWYPGGIVAHNFMMRLRVPFHILRWEPRATIQFSHNPRAGTIRANLNIQIPNCNPSPSDLIVNLAEMNRFPAPPGIKMAVGFAADVLKNLDEDFSAITSSEGFLPSHRVQMEKQREAVAAIRGLVKAAFVKLDADHPPASVLEHPTQSSEDALCNALISLFALFDAFPNPTRPLLHPLTLFHSSLLSHTST